MQASYAKALTSLDLKLQRDPKLLKPPQGIGFYAFIMHKLYYKCNSEPLSDSKVDHFPFCRPSFNKGKGYCV